MAGLQQSPLQKRDRRFESGSLQRRVTREPASGAPSWTTFTDRRGVANRIEPTRFQIVREIPPQRREPILMDAERQALDFGVEIGEYRGVAGSRGAFSNGWCRAPHARALRRSLSLQRTRFEGIAERKVRQRQLTHFGNRPTGSGIHEFLVM
jgi:hypothetical protein